jgi:hypothetical protein
VEWFFLLKFHKIIFGNFFNGNWEELLSMFRYNEGVENNKRFQEERYDR